MRLLIVIMSGFGLHQLYTPTQSLGERWGSMFREAIGVIGMLPGLLLIRDGVSDNDNDSLTVSYLLAALSFGIGVMIGHLVDRMSDEH